MLIPKFYSSHYRYQYFARSLAVPIRIFADAKRQPTNRHLTLLAVEFLGDKGAGLGSRCGNLSDAADRLV